MRIKISVCFLLLSSAAAFAVEVPVDGDAFVNSALPANNFGNLPNLNVGGGARAFISFNLNAALPSGTTGAGVSKAMLYIYVNRVGVPGAIDIFAAASPWTESAVTNNTAPLPGLPLTFGVPVSTANTWVAVDVTSAVKIWADLPSQNFGFVVEPAANSPATALFLDAKENTGTSHAAKLDVTLAGPAGPQGPAGATGPRGLTGLQGPQGDPGISGLQVVLVTGTVSSGFSSLSLPANCPAPKRVISGGCDAVFGLTNVGSYTPPSLVKATPNGNAYVCLFDGGTGLNMPVATTAVCANVQ